MAQIKFILLTYFNLILIYLKKSDFITKLNVLKVYNNVTNNLTKQGE